MHIRICPLHTCCMSYVLMLILQDSSPGPGRYSPSPKGQARSSGAEDGQQKLYIYIHIYLYLISCYYDDYCYFCFNYI